MAQYQLNIQLASRLAGASRLPNIFIEAIELGLLQREAVKQAQQKTKLIHTCRCSKAT